MDAWTPMDADLCVALFDLAATGCDPALLSRLARLPWPLLLLGETGTGKTVLAQYLAGISGRKGPYHYTSLAQLPEQLAISTIAGHVKGAFTGAVADQQGPFELAHEGTLCLDEIGDCPPGAQGVLLRAVEAGLILRVGEQRWRKVDVRVIACTNADLESLVRQGSFRDDLLARFSVFQLRLLPLRERRAAILPLAERFMAEAAAELKKEPVVLSASVKEALHEAAWPKNIRQLRGVCQYVTAMADEVAELHHLPDGFGAEAGLPEGSIRQRVLQAIEQEGGNKSRAAKRAGISRTHVYRVLEGEEQA